MSSAALPRPIELSAPATRSRGWRGRFRSVEDLLLVMALAAMVALPLAEIVLRRTLHIGILGVSGFVQHLTMIVGMLGGAIAAREGRLLSLSSLELVLSEKAKSVARVISGAAAAAISFYLAVGSGAFMLSEKAAGKTLPYDIPIWLIQCVLPLGFGAIAWRLLWNASVKWNGRVAAVGLAVALAAGAWMTSPPSQPIVTAALIALLAATILGAPIFATLGGAALILFWAAQVPIAAISVDHYRLVTNHILPTVPLFTLAGFFLAEGGASRRMIRLFQALVGHFRGGPALLTALVCAFFTSFTGASGVTILALGGLLLPVLTAAGYSERNAVGLLTGTGSLGLLLPPCLPLIFYAVIAQVSITEMFLGGIIPGILLVLMTAIWGIRQAPRDTAAASRFDGREAWAALWDAKWELLLPVVAFVGLFSGWATPVESAALTAFYAFAVEAWIYRDLKIMRDLPRVMTECGLLVGGVLLILGVALGFTNYLVDAEIPAHAVEWVTATIHSKWTFLLLLNLFLIAVGALMDIYSAIVIVVPLIVPLGRAYGIDPVHLGIVFLANAELGYLMPPVGENLFLASLRFGKPVSQVFRSVIPMLVVFLIGTLLVTYIPALTTSLPRLLAK